MPVVRCILPYTMNGKDIEVGTEIRVTHEKAKRMTETGAFVLTDVTETVDEKMLRELLGEGKSEDEETTKGAKRKSKKKK